MIDNEPRLSIDLTYSDPDVRVIPVGAIVTSAMRVRLRRRILTLAGIVTVMIAVAGATTVIARGSSRSSVDPATVLADLHKPSEPLVIVDRSVRGYESFVYVSSGEVCGGTIGTSGPDKGHLSSTCGWATIGEASSGSWTIKPIFQAMPAPMSPEGKVLGIGLVRGDVSTVSVTFLGTTVTAPVVPIPIGGVAGFGAYAVWLPLHGRTSYGWSDVTSVQGRNAAGEIVVEQS